MDFEISWAAARIDLGPILDRAREPQGESTAPDISSDNLRRAFEEALQGVRVPRARRIWSVVVGLLLTAMGSGGLLFLAVVRESPAIVLITAFLLALVVLGGVLVGRD